MVGTAGLGSFFVAHIPTGQDGEQQDESPEQDTEATEIKGDVIGLGPIIEPTNYGWPEAVPKSSKKHEYSIGVG